MTEYTDPGLAIKKLAANVKARMAGQDQAISKKVPAPVSGFGQMVWNNTTKAWEAAPAGGSPSIGTDANGNPTIDTTSSAAFGTDANGNPTITA